MKISAPKGKQKCCERCGVARALMAKAQVRSLTTEAKLGWLCIQCLLRVVGVYDAPSKTFNRDAMMQSA